MLRKFYKGENCYQWKGGKPKCQKCGKQLANFYAVHCREHMRKKPRKFPYAKCQDCGKELNRGARLRKNKFCKEHQFKGERSPHWQGGITPINLTLRNSAKYKRWRAKCFKRDNWTCQSCGYHGKGLQVDHIYPWSLHKKLRFVIKNGRTLCQSCHGQLGWKYRPSEKSLSLVNLQSSVKFSIGNCQKV